MHRWFTDASGLGLAEQARRVMHPDPPTKEAKLAEHVERWQDKMLRLEVHGDESKLAPVSKINASPKKNTHRKNPHQCNRVKKGIMVTITHPITKSIPTS